LAAVEKNGLALAFVPFNLENYREVALAAVEKNGWALEDAKDLQNDIEVVSAAVKQNGLALEFASEVLKNNEEVVSAAVEQNGLALGYASDDLKNNISTILINNMEHINSQNDYDKYTCFSKICNNIYYFKKNIAQTEDNTRLDIEALKYIIEDAQSKDKKYTKLIDEEYAKLTDEKLKDFLTNVDNIIKISGDQELISSFKNLEIKNDKGQSVKISNFIKPGANILCAGIFDCFTNCLTNNER